LVGGLVWVQVSATDGVVHAVCLLPPNNGVTSKLSVPRRLGI